MPGCGWVFAPGLNDRCRRGIGESLVSFFGHAGNADGSLSARANEAVSGHPEGSGLIEQDWTRIPAADQAGQEARDPTAIYTALGAMPVELGRMLEDASAEALTQPSHDGGAAVVELVAHLRDWEAVVDGWVERMLADDDLPILDVPDDSLWAIEQDYAAEDPHRAFAAFRERRLGLVALLDTLDEAGWAREGTFDGDGPRTVRQVLDVLCDRDADHLRRAREALT